MRSLLSTFLLLLAAAALCVLAGWQWRQGNFDSVFGAPPTPVGSRLYTSFHAGAVKHIRVSGGGTAAAFSLTDKGWQASAPWTDRMDPRAAVGIINFALGLRVEDFAEAGEVDSSDSGLGETAIIVRLEDAARHPLAHFKLGRATPWKAELEEGAPPVSTVYIQPRDKNRKRHIYTCTGDINPLFKDNFRFLRDHHPFYFNPLALQKIRIRSQQGDLTLGRADPQGAWRIVKPLDLPTDRKAMVNLLEGLYELQAVKLADRAAVPQPAKDSSARTSQIAITSFGSEAETILEILPPESPDAKDVQATVSDRPDTVFSLPLKPEQGVVSLANLPLAPNELRDYRIAPPPVIDIASLRGVSIQPATGAEIVVSRTPPQPWMAASEGVTTEANEENLYELLKAVTTGLASGFVSDAATDFTPWGLHRPVLTLRFLHQNNQAVELRFGIDGKGGWFANRLGTPTVMKVDEMLVSSIAVRPFEWKHSRLWSVDRVNLIGIKHTRAAEPPTLLRYSDNDQAWQAGREGADLTATLDPARANYMLDHLEGLKVTRWLATDDPGAAAALKNPSLTLTVTEFITDPQGENQGVQDRTLTFAPAAPGANPGFYYGKLESEPNPFLLDSGTYGKIALDLFEK